MEIRKSVAHAVALCALGLCTAACGAEGQWTVERAKAWGAKQPWYCGVNYIPANAINYTAMWDKTSFSPEVMRRELKLMTDMGMNCVRVVLQYKVYEDDSEFFLAAFERFLCICDEAKIRVMPIFFDDCCFGENRDPVVGVQSEPLEGWYAWAWSPSPGHSMVSDPRTHGKLEKYVKDVMQAHKNDPRVFVWDLYNEPRPGAKSRTWPLLKKTVKWAREVNPVQPLSICVWCGDKEQTDYVLENSDVVTFHCYKSPENTEKDVKRLLATGRPVICTEWLNRPHKSTVAGCLPVFAANNVGCIQWGLVNGKTQTHLPWGHRPEMLPYKGVWQHDIFRGDLTPYDPAEIALFKKTIQEKNGK